MIQSNLNVLLVEDAEITRRIIREMLQQCGFAHVDEASNGAEGWKQMLHGLETKHPYQLVVADWSMPQMSGIDLMRKIHAHPTYQKTPFILLTSHNERPKVMEAIRAGVGHYLVKPFSAESLKAKVREALGKKAA